MSQHANTPASVLPYRSQQIPAQMERIAAVAPFEVVIARLLAMGTHVHLSAHPPARVQLVEAPRQRPKVAHGPTPCTYHVDIYSKACVDGVWRMVSVCDVRYDASGNTWTLPDKACDIIAPLLKQLVAFPETQALESMPALRLTAATAAVAPRRRASMLQVGVMWLAMALFCGALMLYGDPDTRPLQQAMQAQAMQALQAARPLLQAMQALQAASAVALERGIKAAGCHARQLLGSSSRDLERE